MANYKSLITGCMVFAGTVVIGAVGGTADAAKVGGHYRAPNDSRAAEQSCIKHYDNGAYKAAVAAANLGLTQYRSKSHVWKV